MYLLGDVPPEASRLFTSFNPVSHIMAAYHNVYWYGHPFSLSVLPFAFIAGAALLVAMWRLKLFPATRPSIPSIPSAVDAPLTLIILQGKTPRLSVMSTGIGQQPIQYCFGRWRERMRDVSGSGLVRMLLVMSGQPREVRNAAFDKIKQQSGLGRLFDSDLALYPDAMADQLAFYIAMRWPFEHIVLDGLLNSAPPDFLERAWRYLEAEASKERRITVIADRPLSVPQGERGGALIVTFRP